MIISVNGFSYHKPSETFEDCADKIAFAINNGNAKFAISDGVTMSWYPEIWSQILVKQYVSTDGLNISDVANNDILVQCQNKWLDEVNSCIGDAAKPWWIENIENKESSASATFAGLTLFYENNLLNYEAVSIGDTFLYILSRDCALKFVFPENEVFNNTPNYLDSRGRHKGVPIKKSSVVEAGYYILMTDALAEWFSLSPEKNLEKVLTWETYDDFCKSIDLLRSNKEIKIDDTAIIVLNVSQSSTINNITILEWSDGTEPINNIVLSTNSNEKKKAIRKRFNLSTVLKNGSKIKLNQKIKKRKQK
jgi:hypothetical protein